MHGVMGKPPDVATEAGRLANSRTMLFLLVLMTGVAPISLYMLVPALPVLATTFGRDISVAQMTVSLYMVGIACSQIIMGPLSDRFGRRPVLLGGIGLMVAASVGLHFRRDAAAADCRAVFPGARRRLRHGGEPRHHPRPLQPRPHLLHDQPRDRGHDDRADAVAADRRPAGNHLRLARDLLSDHRGVAFDHDHDRRHAAGNPARPRRGLQLSRRCRKPVQEPRLHRLRAVPGAGLADDFCVRRRRALHRGDPDGPLQRRIRRVVCDHGICVSGRQPVLRPLRAAPLAGDS